MADLLGDIASALSVHGLIPRGGFSFVQDEEAPTGLSGKPARSVLLVGHGGDSHWAHFTRWRQANPRVRDPLDSWSRLVLSDVAGIFGARAVLASDRPWLPIQTWAMRAEGVRPSPLGILIHPEYGLWHAYRGVLLFDVEIPIQAVPEPIHPCRLCSGKPCLNACPVMAVSAEAFDDRRCREHVCSAAGHACRYQGCGARLACPVGTAYRYPPAMQAFHMAAFAGLEEVA
jgi:hypothetical protein